LRARFPQVAEKVVIINHGNWIDFYPRSISRQDARGKLGIPQHAFAYLFIGLCKEYKNLDVLIDRFTRLPGNISLTIAGHFQSAEYLHRIHELAATDPRIMLHPRIIPNDELQEFLISADAVVLPYREILTSGTAMLAMSFGRPVVSIRHGHLRDVITPATGILYDPHDANGLLRALIEIRSRCFDETLILRHAKTFEWKDAASVFLGAL
jgi:glycosyltransferase involved in cell wall biosynthesis